MGEKLYCTHPDDWDLRHKQSSFVKDNVFNKINIMGITCIFCGSNNITCYDEFMLPLFYDTLCRDCGKMWSNN